MSYESQIREKHQLEDEAKKNEEHGVQQLYLFRNCLSGILYLARAMTTKELEVAMARFADKLTDEKDPVSELSLRSKVMLLKAEFDLRIARLSKLDQDVRISFEHQNYWDRFLTFKWSRTTEEYLLKLLIIQPLLPPVNVIELADWMHRRTMPEIEAYIRTVDQKK